MRKRLTYGLWSLLTMAAFAFMGLISVGALAADKGVGGDCCADLEERIAELEAITAHKDNRKVSLTVYGQISKALEYVSVGSYHHTSVVENSNEDAQSFVGFKGEAKVSPNLKVGFVAEIGIGSFDQGNGPGYGPFGGDTNGIYTRQGFIWFGDIEKYGKLSIGKTAQATYGVAGTTLANTNVAETKLSVEPLVGPQIGTVLNLWDGQYANVLRYDSPAFYGFALSASWSDAVNPLGSPTEQGSVWDVAVRYFGEFGKRFQIAGAAGYRDGIVVPTVFNITDVKVFSGSIALKDVPTGLFLNGSYGDLDASKLFPGLPHVKAWAVQGGVEEKWTNLGKTTVFGSYGQFDLPGSTTPTVMGLGVVQALDAAAMDVYLTAHRYKTDGFLTTSDVDVIFGGFRIRF